MVFLSPLISKAPLPTTTASEDETEKKSFKSEKYIKHCWDKDDRVQLRTSHDLSGIDRFLEFMDDAYIDMAVLTIQSLKVNQMKMWHDH